MNATAAPAPSQAHATAELPAGDEPILPHRLAGRAALKRSDRADAKRRRPAAAIDAFAQRRGLDYLGSRNAAGYFAALPLDERLQFNVMRGPLSDTRHGCLFHHLLAWPVDAEGDATGGPFYDYIYNPKLPKGWWKPNRTWIPVAGWLISDPNEDPDPMQHAIGVPCTAAATTVPEAGGLPLIRFENRKGGGLFGLGAEKLNAYGFSRWCVEVSGPRPDAVLERLLNGPLRSVLQACQDLALCRIDIDHSTVTITCDGFLMTDAELDGLLQAAVVAGDAVAQACMADAAPQPFEQPLASADWPSGNAMSKSGRFPPAPWLDEIHRLAARLGMTLEDVPAYRHQLPSIPVPGSAFAVLRGPIPGAAAAFGRVVLSTEQNVWRRNQGRNSVLLPAASGAEPTPPGGVRDAETGLTYAISGGVYTAWMLRSSGTLGDLGDIDRLINVAVEFGRRHALIA